MQRVMTDAYERLVRASKKGKETFLAAPAPSIGVFAILYGALLYQPESCTRICLRCL